MSKLSLPQAIQRIQENDERMDRFANGGDTETFTTSGGVVIPSFAKFVKDHDAQLTQYPIDVASTSGASLVGFSQAGAGSIARTVRDELRDRINVRQFIGSAVDGVTSNQAGIVAAVAAALATDASLEWPAGTYVSDANIPNFHSVRHVGSGVVKRGTDTWVISGKTGTNILYVATTGNDSNDGLSSAQPLATVQRTKTIFENWTDALLRNGTFRVQLAAGTYNAPASFDTLRSRQRIQFRGPAVGGHPNVPTAIIDGTGQSTVGWFFQNYMFVQLQDLKFTNWDIHGVAANMHSNMWTNNVHTAGNGGSVAAGSNGSGIDAEIHARVYVSGGIHNNPGNSFRLYANSVATYGYQGSASANRPQITGATGGKAGIVIRDQSSAHVDYCDITGNAGDGIHLINNSRVHITESNVTGNYYNVNLEMGSTYINTNSVLTGATSGRNVVQFGMSMDNASLQKWYFDEVNGRWRVGLETNTQPQALMHFIHGNGAGAMSYNGNSRLIVESDSNSHIAIGLPTGSFEGGLAIAKPGTALLGKFVYNESDDTWRMTINSADAFRWGATSFLPIGDNTKALGGTSNRFSNIFGVNLVLTPPASNTPANNGQMVFELTSDTQLKIKVKGSDGVVRAATLTLA